MFVQVGTRPSQNLRPDHSGIAQGDWDILADYWYPVAIDRDLSDSPMAVQILDVPLVVYRGSQGEIAVALDICPHRHVRLSEGKVIDGEIECPFHGLRFDAEGMCRRVPALGRDARLPKSYRVRTFPVKLRYGLIWTCIGTAERHDVPDFPTLNVDASEFAYTVPVIWPVSSPRQVENFVDLAHLPFVHATTLGGDQTAPVTAGKIVHGANDIVMDAHFVETGPDGKPMPCDLHYRIVLPFSIEFKTVVVGVADYYIESADIPVPVSADRCMVFQIVRHPKGRDAAEAAVPMLTEVNEQDIKLLATTMTPYLPLEQHHEIHLPVDNVSNAYRARLRDLGLGKNSIPAALADA